MNVKAEQENEPIVIETEAAGEVVEQESNAAPEDQDEDGEVIVSIGDPPPPEQEEAERAPEWVRELRKSDREKTKRIKELEAKLNGTVEVKPSALPPKPTLESCDYDEDEFDRKLDDWYSQKRAHDEHEAKQKEAEQQQNEAWQANLASYEEAKKVLKVKDFGDAELTVQETLNVTQQGLILHCADNPALLIYALGKNEAKAKELASINDLAKFTFAVAKLETQLKVSNRKAPPPEKTISGSSPISGTTDSQLERLREEAAKTGDYSKVVQYKRQKQQA